MRVMTEKRREVGLRVIETQETARQNAWIHRSYLKK